MTATGDCGSNVDNLALHFLRPDLLVITKYHQPAAHLLVTEGQPANW
jgi:hypothetical protein